VNETTPTTFDKNQVMLIAVALATLLGRAALFAAPHRPPPVPRAHVSAVQLAPSDQALRCLHALLEARGRCSLSEAGELLRAEGVALPPGQSLTEFVEGCAEFSLSGRPSNRKVSLAQQTTASALVRFVTDVLAGLDAPVTMPELKLRISERGRFVPGLSTLLRSNTDTFVVSNGLVSLSGGAAAADAVSSAAGRVRQPNKPPHS